MRVKVASFRGVCAVVGLVLTTQGAVADVDMIGGGMDFPNVVRVAILGTSLGDGTFSAEAISISVGSGEDLEGYVFGDTTTGAIGTAISPGIIGLGDGLSANSTSIPSNPYETNLCADPCTLPGAGGLNP